MFCSKFILERVEDNISILSEWDKPLSNLFFILVVFGLLSMFIILKFLGELILAKDAFAAMLALFLLISLLFEEEMKI